MATVNPVRSAPGGGCTKVFWEALATGDTIGTDLPARGEPVGSVQVTGTFGGATVTLTGSNDGTNYVTMKDVYGTAISFTSAGMANFNGLPLYIKPAISGGTSDDVDVTIIYRGV